jgi:succinylglutamate desuccinylase
MLVAVGGIHGNEPAGAIALTRVVEKLDSAQLLVRGDVIALAGNIAALVAGQRFIDEDLNRRFGRRPFDESVVEDSQRRELLSALDDAFARARGPVVLIDLHTTSGDGAPFGVFADTMVSRNFARRFPVPLVLGLEEQVAGTLVDFVGLVGHAAVGFEGGQHQDPKSVDNLEAIVWMALAELELVSRPAAAERRALENAVADAPRLLEVTYRHDIDAVDNFAMLPGFRSFQRVERGQIVADDVRGAVAAPDDGYLLMPLYQKQGNDGFFLVQKVWVFWLWLSAVLRYARAGRIVHWLPGVERVDGDNHRVLVTRHVARWYSLQFLHLLGFRRLEESGDSLVMQRRAHDLP